MKHLRIGRVFSTLLSLVVLVKCGGDAPPEVLRDPPGSTGCVPGELTLSDGRCQPAGLPPDMPCPPGQRALPTSSDGACTPAGVPPEACAPGRFAPDGRGGCAPILPEMDCAFGHMAVPGESACREVAPCGEGPWGELPVDPTTQYVDQAYPGSDGDGSREKPWKTVQAGILAASSGAIVAIAEGRYAEDVLVESKAVRLWGRCPARTEVVGLGAARGAVVVSSAGASGTEVRGLAVTGSRSGIVVRGARSVALEEVWIHNAGSYGVYLLDRAGVSLRGALLESNRTLGVAVEGSDAAVEATVVRATRVNSAGQLGRGVHVQPSVTLGAAGSLSLAASLIERSHEYGVFISGEATIEATVVRATQPDAAGWFGRGIEVHPDAETGARGKLSLATSLVEDNQESGVNIYGSDATIEATVVRATRLDSAGAFGRGINVQASPETGERGTLSLAASLIEENHEFGVFIEGEATVESTVVRATRSNEAGEFGWGIGVQPDLATGDGGKLSLTSSLVEDNQELGVFVTGSEATVESTVVRATRSNETGAFGRGIHVQPDPETGHGGRLSLTSSLVEDNREFGVFVTGSEATVETTVVRANQPDGAGKFGRGIAVQAYSATGARGRLSLTSSLIEENHDVGVFVSGSEATIVASVVRATQREPASEDYGDGILVDENELGPSSATITATAATDNVRAGVMYIASTGELSFVRSSGNRYGLVIQNALDGVQLTRGEGNVFEGNTERNQISGGDLPVPDAAPPLP